MSWQPLIFISVVTYAISVVMQRIILKDNKSDAIAYSIIFQLIVGFLLLIYAITSGFQMPDLTSRPLNYLLMTLLYGAGNVLMYKSLQHIHASQFTILFSTRVFWTILAALLVLREPLNLNQIVGTMLIITGVILASWQGRKLVFSKGEQFALCAGLCYGLAFANDAYILQNVDAASYTAFSFIVPPLMLWLLNPIKTLQIQQLLQKNMLMRITLIAIIYGISISTLNVAYQIGRNSAQIAPLTQTSTLLTVLFGIIILKEREALTKKIIASIITFIGILLLI